MNDCFGGRRSTLILAHKTLVTIQLYFQAFHFRTSTLNGKGPSMEWFTRDNKGHDPPRDDVERFTLGGSAQGSHSPNSSRSLMLWLSPSNISKP